MRSLSWGCACHGTVASHLLAELPKPALNPVLHCLAGLGRPPLDLLGELVEGRVGRGRGVQLPERLVVDPKVLSEHEVVVLVRHGGGSAGGKPRPLGAGLGCYCLPIKKALNFHNWIVLARARSKDFLGLVGKSHRRPNRRPGHTHSASPNQIFFFCLGRFVRAQQGIPTADLLRFVKSSVSTSRKDSFEFEGLSNTRQRD